MNRSLNISAIVVAAGSGNRFGSELPKQFCTLAGVPVVVMAIRALRSAIGADSQVVVVVSPSEMQRWRRIADSFQLSDVVAVAGGDNRWESVRNGLEAVADDTDVVLVHDGARPLVDAPTVARVVAAAAAVGSDGAIPTVDVVDSLRHRDSDGNSYPVDRSELCAVQTPQGFPADKLRKAYKLPYSKMFTDDASVMAAAGFTDVKLVDGSVYNIKITYPLDLEVAELYLRRL